jgi:hypothetical protein
MSQVRLHRMRAPLEERYIPEPNSGCWLWIGSWNNMGYGQLLPPGSGRGKPLVLAHRYVYERLIGPIPKGMVIDHALCSTPSCVNPRHMVVTTQRANVLRGSSPAAKHAKRVVCLRGHPLDGIRKSGFTKTGKQVMSRYCTICARDRVRRPGGLH